jgi:hypothetical protein
MVGQAATLRFGFCEWRPGEPVDQAAMVTHERNRRSVRPVQSQQSHPGRVQHGFAFKKFRVPAMSALERFAVHFVFARLVFRHGVSDLSHITPTGGSGSREIFRTREYSRTSCIEAFVPIYRENPAAISSYLSCSVALCSFGTLSYRIDDTIRASPRPHIRSPGRL